MYYINHVNGELLNVFSDIMWENLHITDENDAWCLLEQALYGLKYLHEQGFVHTDIKRKILILFLPHNVTCILHTYALLHNLVCIWSWFYMYFHIFMNWCIYIYIVWNQFKFDLVIYWYCLEQIILKLLYIHYIYTQCYIYILVLITPVGDFVIIVLFIHVLAIADICVKRTLV